MTRTRIIMLGTGTPNAEVDRVSSGIVIEVDNHPYLIDCGHGIVQRVVEAHHKGIISWDTTNLTRLFITHLHADHTVGLPDLMFTPWIHNRIEKIQAYGPAELESMVSHLLLAFAENIREHTTVHPSTDDGYKIDVHEVEEGKCYADERVAVYALRADHGRLTAYSYKFVTVDRTIVISGDTKPVPGFIKWAKGCDVLIHEVYSSQQFKGIPSEWKTYHSSVHTSTDELASLANEIQPEILVLCHQLFWGLTPDELVAEITVNYSGAVVSANDFNVF